MNNIVIRKCDHCRVTGKDGEGFTYLRDGVWACWNCGSKYTSIANVIDPDKAGG